MIDNIKCPKCKNKLLYFHTVLYKNDVKYEVLCSWCNYKSKIFNNKKEAIKHYENAIL